MAFSVTDYLRDIEDLLAQVPVEAVESVIAALVQARYNEKQVFLMGNGGSAATADHFACDLGKGTRQQGIPPFRAIALTGSLATLTALANDDGYEHIFSGQLANLVQPGDLVIGISASGNSPNVVNAVQVARQAGARTIGFTGFDGGRLGELVNIQVHIPSHSYEQVEDLHLILEHSICTTLRAGSGSPMSAKPGQLLVESRNGKQVSEYGD